MAGPRSTTTEYRHTTGYTWDDRELYLPPSDVEEFYAFGTDSLLESAGHRGHKDLGKIRGDVGGNFSLIKHKYAESTPIRTGMTYIGARVWKDVPQYAVADHVNDTWFPHIVPTSPEVLLPVASDAIAGLIPTSPRVNSAAMVGELLSDGGIPHLSEIQSLKSRAYKAKSAGKAYLQTQFGWAPLLKDTTKLYNTIKNKNKILEDFIEHSGTKVKRSWKAPLSIEVDTRTEPAIPAPGIVLTSSPYDGPGTLKVTTTTEVRRWVECCFTYYVPPYVEGSMNLARQEQLANYLFGERITPSVLWQIAPWSWASDWVINIGPVIKNYTELNQNDLQLEYAYIMESKTQTVKYELTQSFKRSSEEFAWRASPELQGKTMHLFQEFTTETKQRLTAGPFNVGFKWEGLTPFQISIAVALGFTRLGKLGL